MIPSIRYFGHGPRTSRYLRSIEINISFAATRFLLWTQQYHHNGSAEWTSMCVCVVLRMSRWCIYHRNWWPVARVKVRICLVPPPLFYISIYSSQYNLGNRFIIFYIVRIATILKSWRQTIINCPIRIYTRRVT